MRVFSGSALRLAAMGGVCALALGFSASPAAAGNHSSLTFGYSAGCNGASDTGSQGRFLHDGDRFFVGDVCRDGHSAVLLGTVRGDSAPEVVVWASEGVGDESVESYNVAEGTTVRVRACIGDFADEIYWGCGSWEQGVA
ncbi:hypothetical protein ACFXAZ_38000 [Streptomyces sp. NPDC059477]|uniref:hypothetical protein n=1 Tax=Streptomyces sp. NPDC059477 TaxID=3346847 RepID=UPI0036BAA9A1